MGSLVIGLLNRFSAAACLALLYIAESGVPVRVPPEAVISTFHRTYHADRAFAGTC